MRGPSVDVIGRAHELGLAESFFEAARPGIGALVFRGAPGIGKTTLWQAALAMAEARGHRALTTRPTEAEARLPFAGLTDLLGSLVDTSRDHLPPPQQDALEIALMRRSGTEQEAVQPLALSLAVMELLRIATRERPIVLAIDDVQWLDESTGGVLRFAMRRIERESLVVVATERTIPGSPRSGIVAEIPVDRIVDVEVAPLDPGAIDDVLASTLGLELPPTMVRRVHAMSGGNPLYAVEIGRALRDRNVELSDQRIPLPESLGELLRARLAALPPEAGEVTVHAAALSHPASDTLAAALGEDRMRAGLAASRAAGVLAPDDPIRFTHPLLAAEAYAALDGGQRRALHRRLAAVVAEPEELARHLALGADGPDPEVAEALDLAADHAQRRAALDAAADLSEMASRLTIETDAARAHRMAVAGRYRLMAGDTARARDLLERALLEPAAAAGPPRAELLVTLAMVRQLMDDFGAAASLGTEALEHAGDDVPLRIQIKLLLAGVSYITGLEWTAGARHADEAMALAEKLGDPRVLAGTIGHFAAWRHATGHRLDGRLQQTAEQLEPWTVHLRTLDRAEFDFSGIHFMEGETAQAHAATRRLLTRAEQDGDYSSLPFLLGNMAFVEFAEGNAAGARESLLRAERMAAVTEQSTARVHILVHRARIEARQGSVEGAREAAIEAFRIMDENGWRIAESWLRADLALLELSRHDPEAALEWLGDGVTPSTTDPTDRLMWVRAPAIEALVTTGRLEHAAALLETLRTEAARSGAPRILAEAHRARARVESALGNLDEATEAIAEAERLHRRFDDSWELGRTLLVAAEIHRRARRRAKAHASLSEALALFDRLSASLWAREAREQLERIGGRRTEDGLTPTQREVAMLVAGGMTNRQVGDRLFMSPHTVEAHLTAVYRALGIRSRAELGRALARDEATPRDSESGTRDSAPDRPREI